MGDTQLFLVRVWRHFSQFCASVRGIDQEEPLPFAEPDRLCEFLRDASEGPRDVDVPRIAVADAGPTTTGGTAGTSTPCPTSRPSGQ
jgi:hypothetical protein